MSEQHKALAIKALEQMRGDDLPRARIMFAGKSKQQLQQQYGASERTCAEILSGCERHEKEIDAAIQWVQSQR